MTMTPTTSIGAPAGPRLPKSSGFGVLFAGVVGVVYAAGIVWALGAATYDVWGAMIIAPVLFLATMVIVSRIRHSSPDMARLIMIGLVMKFVGTAVRFSAIYIFYGGRGDDANQYHINGALLAQLFQHGHFDLGDQRIIGTHFIDIVTGVIYSVTGVTKFGGFLVFSWLAFLGMLLFYSAFRLAFPTGDHRRYAYMIFFMPSLLFWPSSIGKEAWMMFVLGITAYGAARVVAHLRFGFILFAIGLAGTAAVRPHVTLAVLVAFVPAYLLRRQVQGGSSLGPVTKVLGVLVLVGASFIVVDQVESFLHLDSLDSSTIEQALNNAQTQSTTQSSAFGAVRPHNIVDFPFAVVTVLFRPFPTEAHNGQSLVAAGEGLLLLLLTLGSTRSLRLLPRQLFREPYVAFGAGYSALFIFAFSSFGNFGILARERIQLFPFYFVLLCLSTGAGRPRGDKTKPKVTRVSGYGVARRSVPTVVTGGPPDVGTVW